MLRRSDWRGPLSARQLRYAATDAAVSLFVFHELVNALHFGSSCDVLRCSFHFRLPCQCQSMFELLSKLVDSFRLSKAAK